MIGCVVKTMQAPCGRRWIHVAIGGAEGNEGILLPEVFETELGDSVDDFESQLSVWLNSHPKFGLRPSCVSYFVEGVGQVVADEYPDSDGARIQYPDAT